MKARFWALIVSLVMGATAMAQGPALPKATNGLAANSTGNLAEIRTKAEKGDAAAQFDLGAKYYVGNGVTQDWTEAARWYRKAADQGYAPAEADLAACYGLGNGVRQDDVEATKWARKAADQGDALCQIALGYGYSYGKGVPQDYVASAKWYRQAANQGQADAQYNLGVLYHEGKGVPQDYAQAVTWYRKAAQQDNASAQYNLGVCYRDGEGVPQDYIEAVDWFRKAADQGHVSAQSNLGACYANGNGVLRDYVQAYKWDNLASAQGENSAKQFLPFLELIAEAQRLAREFRPSRKAELIPSLPPVWTQDASPRATGTGFFITHDGFLVTAAHVVNSANQIRLVTAAGLLNARLVKLDSANDLALLKAEGHFSALPVVSSRAVKLGNTVATVGFPNIGLQGFSPKLAKGEIASLAGTEDDPRYFQISVPVQPGNSGGALVDERGNVIGVVESRLNAATALAMSGALPENVNYAVKSSFLLGFLEAVPEVSAKLTEANTKDGKFEDEVHAAEQATVLLLVY
jgi:hypothetical protein